MQLLKKLLNSIGWTQAVPAQRSLSDMVSASAPPVDGFGSAQPTDVRDLDWSVFDVVVEAFEHGMSVSSNYARAHAAEVAAAASSGFITTDSPSGFTRTWRPTELGVNLVMGVAK